MKLYKRTIQAFGGTALYLDKCILQALNIECGDEIVIDIQEGKVTLTKPTINIDKIQQLLNATKPSK